MLAENLEDARIKAKVIERDEKRCEEIAETLKTTLVINGDGTDLALLNEEDIAFDHADIIKSALKKITE